MKYDYDVIVIGAGSGGLTAAQAFAAAGKSVLLVERGPMGGECTNSGCIPSKSLIHHAREYFLAKKVAGRTPKLAKYRDGVLDLVREKIEEIRDEESPEEMEKKGVKKVVKGAAKFVDRHSILVDKPSGDAEKFSGKRIVIATGSSPREMNIPGLEEERLLTNENIFRLEKIPGKMLIVGAGPIGMEMAEAFAHLGTNVTILNRSGRIASKEEPEISALCREAMEELGVEVLVSGSVKKCDGDKAYIEFKDGKKKEVEFDYLLLALGRVPNTDGLELEAAGIDYDERGIKVDKHYRTSARNVFAIGDVSSPMKFTHTASEQGRHVMWKSVLGFASRREQVVPKVTFLNHEIASTGMTWEQAQERYGNRKVAKVSLEFGASDRAKTDESQEGVAIVIYKRFSGKILGASIMGRNAGELISVFTLAIENGVSFWKINKTIFPYPTYSMLIKRISDEFLSASLKSLGKDFARLVLPKVLLAVILVIGVFGVLWSQFL